MQHILMIRVVIRNSQYPSVVMSSLAVSADQIKSRNEVVFVVVLFVTIAILP